MLFRFEAELLEGRQVMERQVAGKQQEYEGTMQDVQVTPQAHTACEPRVQALSTESWQSVCLSGCLSVAVNASHFSSVLLAAIMD